MNSLVEDDDSGAQGGQRDVQPTAGRGGLQLPGEVLQVGVRSVAKELEEVVMETVGVGTVDDQVGDGQDFEEQAGTLALVASC